MRVNKSCQLQVTPLSMWIPQPSWTRASNLEFGESVKLAARAWILSVGARSFSSISVMIAGGVCDEQTWRPHRLQTAFLFFIVAKLVPRRMNSLRVQFAISSSKEKIFKNESIKIRRFVVAMNAEHASVAAYFFQMQGIFCATPSDV